MNSFLSILIIATSYILLGIVLEAPLFEAEYPVIFLLALLLVIPSSLAYKNADKKWKILWLIFSIVPGLLQMIYLYANSYRWLLPWHFGLWEIVVPFYLLVPQIIFFVKWRRHNQP